MTLAGQTTTLFLANRIWQWRMAMANTLVRVFDRFSDAEAARNELLAAGFPASSVQLTPTEDEAGPVEGNFIIGNASTSRGGVRGVLSSLIGGDPHTYEHDYAKVAQRGTYLLTVEADNDDQLALASDITKRFGGIDVDERASKRNG
jgi:secreted protein with Ig-like and vWFA domain